VVGIARDVASALALGVALRFLCSPSLLYDKPKTVRAADRRHVNEICAWTVVHFRSTWITEGDGEGGGREGNGNAYAGGTMVMFTSQLYLPR
jgi:hypothetical protein